MYYLVSFDLLSDLLHFIMFGFKITAVIDPQGLKTRENRISDSYPIYLKIYRGTKALIKLPLDNISLKFWNNKNNSNKWVKSSFGLAEIYNDEIQKAKYHVEGFIIECQKSDRYITPVDVKQWYESKYLGKSIIKKTLKRSEYIFIKDYFELIIKDLKHSKKSNTIKVYNTTRDHLEEFAPRAMMKDISKDFIRNYIDYFSKDRATKKNRTKNLNPNSLEKDILKIGRIYKMYCNEFQLSTDYYLFKDLGIKATGKAENTVVLLNSEREKIENLILSGKDQRYELARIIFIILSNTGLYYDDGLIHLKRENIKFMDNNPEYMVLEGKRQKNNNSFWIPLNDQVKECLKELDYPNHEYLVPSNIRTTSKTINLHLKKIAELAKLKINLSIEVARNTFSSFLKHKVSDYLIDEMLGHSHKSVRDRNYTNIRNLETYLEIMEVLNGKGKEINS